MVLQTISVTENAVINVFIYFSLCFSVGSSHESETDETKENIFILLEFSQKAVLISPNNILSLNPCQF